MGKRPLQVPNAMTRYPAKRVGDNAWRFLGTGSPDALIGPELPSSKSI